MLALLLLAVIAFAEGSLAAGSCDQEDKNQCCDFLQNRNQLNISRMTTYDQSACTLGVYYQQSTARFRRFGFGSDGQVSIFMQVEGNNRSSATQSFLIYPFGENPTLKAGTANQLEVDTGSGQVWSFNTQTRLLTAVDTCSITASPAFSTSSSGVTLSNCEKHLVVVTPVEVGGEYISYPDKPLTIKDPQSKTCAITTSDLYNYIEKGPNNTKDKAGRYYNIMLKYKTNAEMAAALRRKCPNLDTSVLAPAAAARTPFELNFDNLLDPDDED